MPLDASLRPNPRNFFIASTALLFLSFPTLAQENGLHIRNAGAAECSRVSSIYGAAGSETDKAAILNWIAGYTNAQSEAQGIIDIFPLVDSEELVQMVVLVCGENPSVRLQNATKTTIERLRPLWIIKNAAITRIDDGTGVTRMFSAAIRPLQRLLTDKGISISIDGQYGPQTGEAIQAIMASLGLQAIKRPNGIILYTITLPDPQTE